MNIAIKTTYFVLFFFIISVFVSLFVTQLTFAQTATSCWVTNFGNPSSNFSLPEGCGTMRPGVICPPNQPKYVCAYRNIVDHDTPADRNGNGIIDDYWAWTWRDSCECGHRGVDLIARANTPIYSLEDSYVVQAYRDEGGGNMYKLYDPHNKRFYMGLHLIQPASFKKGDTVKKWQIVGYVGHTGTNTSATDHLHLQVSSPCEDTGRNQYTCWIDPKEALENWPNY